LFAVCYANALHCHKRIGVRAYKRQAVVVCLTALLSKLLPQREVTARDEMLKEFPEEHVSKLLPQREVTAPIKELPKGKGKNDLVLSSRVSFIKTGGDTTNWVSGNVSILFNAGTKDAPNKQFLNIVISGSKNALNLKEKEKVTLKGFLSLDAYKNKQGEEVISPKIIALEILEREEYSEEQQEPKQEPKQEPEQEPKQELEQNGITLSEEEIPF
jgi:single-stranded DNA-binding protein